MGQHIRTHKNSIVLRLQYASKIKNALDKRIKIDILKPHMTYYIRAQMCRFSALKQFNGIPIKMYAELVYITALGQVTFLHIKCINIYYKDLKFWEHRDHWSQRISRQASFSSISRSTSSSAKNFQLHSRKIALERFTLFRWDYQALFRIDHRTTSSRGRR